MFVENILRYQGDVFGKHMLRLGVPPGLVDAWQVEWALLTADSEEAGWSVADISTRQVQLMTTAQDLVKNHGL